ARFPGILSPYTYVRKSSSEASQKKCDNEADRKSSKDAGKKSKGPAKKSGSQKWHFVDGGYADSSGAATALDIYRGIEKVAKEKKADVKVILLTSSDPAPKIDDLDGGTFRDMLAPISAIVKVREGLGNQAVARACESLRPNDSCDD